ncbi:MAG: hypothetical protein DMG77_19355, partial [Acidobacteria bacterium]
MPHTSASAPRVRQSEFRFRCIGCGDVGDRASQNFRCSRCKDLLEITYPQWSVSATSFPAKGVVELKSTWKQRRLSSSKVDLSGVWRFREVLPILENAEQSITLREGNTPLYEMPRCSRITGVPRLFAKH